MATVFITSAGSGAGINVSRALRQSSLKDELILWGSDHDALAAGLKFVDRSLMLPKCDDPSFLDALLPLLESQEIKNYPLLLFPTFSKEIPVFAKHQGRIRELGVRMVLASEQAIEICCNKDRFEKWCRLHAIPTPKNLSIHEATEFLRQTTTGAQSTSPGLVVKPQCGSGSHNVFFPRNEEQLRACLVLVPTPLIQEFISGIEVTVDVYCSSDISIIASCARERIKVKGGQMIIGRTIDDAPFRKTIETICRALELLGPSNFQFRYEPSTGKEATLLEVNPRFAAGGLALSTHAGLNIPMLLCKDLLGRPIHPRETLYTKGVVMTRYYDEFFGQEVVS